MSLPRLGVPSGKIMFGGLYWAPLFTEPTRKGQVGRYRDVKGIRIAWSCNPGIVRGPVLFGGRLRYPPLPLTRSSTRKQLH